jgi:hypothetical protein
LLNYYSKHGNLNAFALHQYDMRNWYLAEAIGETIEGIFSPLSLFWKK